MNADDRARLDGVISAVRDGAPGLDAVRAIGEDFEWTADDCDYLLRHVYLVALLHEAAQTGVLAEPRGPRVDSWHREELDERRLRRRRTANRALLAAATLACLVALPVWWFAVDEPSSHATFLRGVDGDVAVLGEQGARHVRDEARVRVGEVVRVAKADPTTPRGPSATLRFEDGTRVVLDAGTVIRLESEAPKRIAVRRGGVLLSVSPQRDAMSVRTAAAEVRILGTELQVRADDARTDVRVVSGRVEVRRVGGRGSAVVAAGRRALVRRDAGLRVERIPPRSGRWVADFENGPPANWHGEFVKEGLPETARGALRSSASGNRWMVSCRSEDLDGLFAIRADSRLRLTLSLERPDWLNVFLGTRVWLDETRREREFRIYKYVFDGSRLEPGEWRTVEIPLSDLHSAAVVEPGDVWRGPSPAADELPVWFAIGSPAPDRGLVLDRVEVLDSSTESHAEKPSP